MTIDAREADHLDALATEIVANYAAARRQLANWTGDFRSTTVGASAPTANPDGREPDPDDDVALTAVERRALGDDYAQRTLDVLAKNLRRLAADGRALWAAADGVAIPQPIDTDAAHLAVVMWTVRRMCRDRTAISVDHAKTYALHLEWIADTCRIHQPPPASRIIDCCHAHAAAGASAEVSVNFRRLFLCEWCGRFRRTHGVNPPPAVVRLHDRGIRMSTTILRRAGVKVVA